MSKKTPLLSIIVPAYNVEQYIHQSMDSILAQTFTDFEVLLVDDGSTDGTAAICDEYAKKDSRIHVIHKMNGGLVSARKAGIQQAVGDFIGYVDGDDWIEKNMYQCLYDSAIRENADIVICDYRSVYQETYKLISHNMCDGVYDKEKLEEEVYPYMLSKGDFFEFGFYPSLCCKLFRKSVLLENQLAVNNKIKLGEDAACFYPCMLDASKVVYLDKEYLYNYRMRDTSISHSIIRKMYTDEILILIYFLRTKFYKHYLWEESLERQLLFYEGYMLDNLFTPHIKVKDFFIDKRIFDQFKLLQNDSLFLELREYSLSIRTSSRLKRLIKTIYNNNMRNRIDLILFRKYELLQHWIVDKL